jgi:long-chain acyl-CoA synthetase
MNNQGGLPLNINLNETTFIKLLQANAGRFGDRKSALRSKTRGIWQAVSWKQYYEQVKNFSLGLTQLGIAAGDTVAVIGNNRPASLFAVIGAQAAGGVALCLYQDSTPAELAILLKRFDVRFVVAEDQEQVDKILEIKRELGSLAGIIYCDPRGMRHYREKILSSFEELSRLGSANDEQHPGVFEDRIARGTGDDIAVICTTSGTTGDPKGALLSYRNLLSMAASLNQVDPKQESDEFVSFLPLAWFGEQMTSLASALSIGFSVNFPEKPETVMADLREIGPHIIFSPPRVWEGIASSVQVRIMDTTPFKRFMYNTFMPVGERVADLRLTGSPIPFFTRIQYALGHLCLFRALRDRLGLSRVRSALTGGSALGPDVFRFFHAIGVNLKQVYGLTEVSGISCIHRDGNIQGSTVGLPLPGTEISISPDGEILLKGDGTFKGYYNDSAATADALRDGWLHSGDAGHFDTNGHLVVIDRLHDVLKQGNGVDCAPQYIESKLKFSPYIKEAVVIGKGRSNLTALVCIEGRIVGKWAGDNKITYTTYSDLTSKPEIADFIKKELSTINQGLPEATRIKRFALLYKDLDADEDELTRTGKVRRAVVEQSYGAIIEGLYQDVTVMPVDVTIALQDGKSSRIITTVHFRNL